MRQVGEVWMTDVFDGFRGVARLAEVRPQCSPRERERWVISLQTEDGEVVKTPRGLAVRLAHSISEAGRMLKRGIRAVAPGAGSYVKLRRVEASEEAA